MNVYPTENDRMEQKQRRENHTKTIAIICQVEKKHVKGKLGGGIMAVERFHAELLNEMGFRVHFITTLDSEDLWPNHNIVMAKLCADCEETFEAAGNSTKQSRGKMNKMRTSAINDYIRTIQPDVIINHSFSLSHLNLCVELSKTMPVLHFLHCLPEAMADMGMFGKFAAYRKLTENGSEVVCVSMYQRDRFVDMLTRRLQRNDKHLEFLQEPIDGTHSVMAMFNRVCYSCIVDIQGCSHHEGYYMVIGRPEADKNIGKLLAGLVELKNKHSMQPAVKIFMAFGGKLDDYEYYREKMAPHIPHLPNVTFYNNQTRDKLLSTLQLAKGLFVTAPESCGIAPMEAMQFGVPSLTICKKDKETSTLHHACFDVMGGDSNFIPIDGTRGEFVESLKTAIEKNWSHLESGPERLRLQKLARQLHGRDARKIELQHAVDDLIDTYKRKNLKPSLLEF